MKVDNLDDFIFIKLTPDSTKLPIYYNHCFTYENINHARRYKYRNMYKR